MAKREKNHFISNARLTEILGAWADECRKKKEKDEPHPPMPDEVAIAILRMVEKYGRMSNFSGYTYLDEMQSEAILTCVRYAHNFDRNKSNNAFAWITQIIHNSFVAVINDEKKEAQKKFELTKELNPKLGKSDFHDIKLDDSNSISIPEGFLN